MIVCRRRAPIFSVRSLTTVAVRAISCTASSVKDQLQPLGRHQGGVLTDEGVFRFGQNADEFLLAEVLQFHPDGKAALQFGNQVATAWTRERPRRR